MFPGRLYACSMLTMTSVVAVIGGIVVLFCTKEQS